MTMASGLYGATFRDILDASALAVDLISDTVQCALVNDTETPDFNADSAWGDASANEVSGTNYTAKGYTLVSKALNTTLNAGYLSFDAGDPEWSTATIADIEGRIIFDDTVASPTVDPMLCATDFGSTYSVTAGTFTVQEATTGIFRITL